MKIHFKISIELNEEMVVKTIKPKTANKGYFNYSAENIYDKYLVTTTVVQLFIL